MDILILAAGKGTRMKSDTPKVLFEIAGKPMLWWVIQSCSRLSPNINILLGHKPELVRQKMPYIPHENIFIQQQQLGTGHAVRTFVEKYSGKPDSLMVLCGDTPMLSADELERFKTEHEKSRAVVSVLSTYVENPYGYGRIVRTDGLMSSIIEEKDADDDVRKIREINSGIYIFNYDFLKREIFDLDTSNAQNEFYLTDLIRKAFNKGLETNVFCGDCINLTGINDIQGLSYARNEIRQRINSRHMDNGVDIYGSDTVWIDADVVIENDVRINPFTVIKGNSVIRKGSVIGPYSYIEDCVSDNASIEYSHAKGAVIGKDSGIGPFSRLREKTVISEKCKVGNFVEIKKSILSDNVKTSHLSYIGDSEIGKNTNIGAGTITCNYDGKNKNRTVIGENSFIGSNTCLVAPVKLGNNAYTAAGSVITRDVPDNALAFGRARQIIKLNYRRESNE